MKILVEGIRYNMLDLSRIFDDSKFYIQNGNEGTIVSVGYYHSFKTNEIVYLLPKVFLKDDLIFGYSPQEIIKKEGSHSITHDPKYLWIRSLLVYFYKSLYEFKKRSYNTLLLHPDSIFSLNTNIGKYEYSYLDLLLSIINFYKKNKISLLFHHVEKKSGTLKKTKWEKIIRTTLPIMDNNEQPVYILFQNKKKQINLEEELLIYFLSIVNYLNEEHSLGLSIDKSYSIIKGHKFKHLLSNGLSKIKKIKYRYFSDTLRRMYFLSELFFSQTDTSSRKKREDEFISINNYNIVFEDMIDKLFSDQLNNNLVDLKNNNDGKIIDHIYEDKSLIDTSNIFYIGDSKYYRPGNDAGKLSIYKQFTYSKNIIQFNIDLFNLTGSYYNSNIRYRDEITEGYAITPNFFIYGHIDNLTDFYNPDINRIGLPRKSFHYEDRLFDRDTLFIQQYTINFLFVIRAYTELSSTDINKFREKVKQQFREQFILFFNNSQDCQFSFYKKKLSNPEVCSFIEKNFKILNGKSFYSNNQDLIIAKYLKDNSLNELTSDFEIFDLE